MPLRLGGHLGHAHALERDDGIVLEGAGQVTFVAGVHPAGRHRRIDHLLEDGRLGALLVGQGSHERGATCSRRSSGRGRWP
jgi:hypothetical protein